MTQRFVRQTAEFVADIGADLNRSMIARAVAEVIATLGPVENRATGARQVVEAVSSIRELRNFPQGFRQTVEVVGSAAKFGKGFIVPLIEVDSFTMFFVFQTEGWVGGGRNVIPFVGTSPTEGIFFKEAANATSIQVVAQFGTTARAVGVIPVPTGLNGKHVVSIVYDRATTTMTIRFDRGPGVSLSLSTSEAYRLRYICGVLDSDEKQAHQIPQILLYANAFPLVTVEAVENYLYCKWVFPGPDEANNYCVPN